MQHVNVTTIGRFQLNYKRMAVVPPSTASWNDRLAVASDGFRWYMAPETPITSGATFSLRRGELQIFLDGAAYHPWKAPISLPLVTQYHR
jgi:hypothetical protein